MKGNAKRRLVSLLAVTMLAGAWTVPAGAASGSGQTTFAQATDGAGQAAAASQAQGKEETGKMESKPVDAAFSSEQAEKLARQYVRIPDDYKLEYSSYSTRKLHAGKQGVWEFQFVKKANGKNKGSIHAAIDAEKGQLIGFSANGGEENQKPSYPLKVDRKGAEAIALGFIKEIAKDYVPQIVLNNRFGVSALPPLTGEVRHELKFDRAVSGLLFVENYINVAVNSEGHVVGFSLNWDHTIPFPKTANPRSTKQALEDIRKQADPELLYIRPLDNEGQKKPRLTYYLPAITIDAVSGKPLQSDPYNFYTGTVSKTPLTEKPLSAPPKRGTVQENDAVAAVEKAFDIPSGMKLNEASFSESTDEAGNKKTTWQLSWILEKNGMELGGIYAIVDGNTGAVTVYSSYAYRQEQSSGGAGITLDQAVKTAEETVKKQLPWLSDELYAETPNAELYAGRKPEQIGQYSVSFLHKINGATVQYDYIRVSVDALTGKVSNFESRISEYVYEEKLPAVVGEAQAVESFLNYYDLQLTYRLLRQYSVGGKNISRQMYEDLLISGQIKETDAVDSSKVELVYQLVPKTLHEEVVLDAASGKWHSASTGGETSLDLPKAVDAKGHWAEEPLNLMVAYKALDLEDGKVRPNQFITRGELIKMLVLARGGGYFTTLTSGGLYNGKAESFKDVAADSDYFAYIESALEQNLIDIGDGSFEPNESVTRDELAELVVRALGYNSLANYDHLFRVQFKDSADIQNKGQAAIAVGLKIMSLSEGKFLPNKKVTRAEASIAFFRYLQKRAELSETPLRI
ncbi:S-layer homology domain-containing protein [Paenibacillus sp. GCM10027627]|uniref:S-layer homology domain-containing protein n=1 Tax=unclassified Paenibacillus TaxID=185978 RepID=UPI003627CF33